MNIDSINKYWQEAIELTKDLPPDEQFSTPELVKYLNSLLALDYEEMTKTKVNYLREQGILKPKENGGEVRTSWRYTADDVRRVILVELLKTHESLSIKEIKVWLLRFFEEGRRGEVLDEQAPHTGTQESQTSPPPTSVDSAYALLRNRALGTLITALGFGAAEMTPPECLIGIRAVGQSAEKAYHSKLTGAQARVLLEKEAWTLAVSDAYFKLYVYTDFIKLQNNRPVVVSMLQGHNWYFVTLQDTVDQLYQVALGLPKSNVQQSSICAIQEALEKLLDNDEPIQLSAFPGLSTLLQAAFIKQLDITKGTTLAVLVEIIAGASDAWDYCDVLTPVPAEDGKEKWLRLLEYSSKFPSQLKGKMVEIGQPLSGWCYRFRQGVVVDQAAENDARIAFYEEEGRPIAAAAMPAIAEEQRVMGVIYVAKQGQSGGKHPAFTEESLASLKAFSYICGDMIARDQIEIETVRSLNRISTRPLLTEFPSLEALVRKVADIVQKGVSPEKVAISWIYLLTLNIQITSKDTISQWLCEQGADLTGNFMAYNLWDPPHRDPLPIGICKIGTNQSVFAVLQAIDLPETQFKKRLNLLQEEIEQISIGNLSPDFYHSAITFRYEKLQKLLKNEDMHEIEAHLSERARESLIAGPYFKRGHDALFKSDLDNAVSEFEGALRYVPNSWYGYKHLAEARMLQGTDIEEAIEKCQKAIELNLDYASAHCLLADCYSYKKRFGEALVEYEKALILDGNRRDFLTRYGLTLAGMTTFEFQDALKLLRQMLPQTSRKYFDQPWDEAIDKFDRVRNLSMMLNDPPEEQRRRRAEYHYHRGFTYLQAGEINKALEDFAVGRKLAPGNLQLAQAYTYALRLQRRKESETQSIPKG